MDSDVIIIPIFLAACSCTIWVLANSIRRYRTAKLQAGIHTSLIEKFGASQDLLAYVQSEAGKNLVESLGVERSSPFGRIFFALQAGVVLIPIGLGFLFLRSHISGAQEGFLVFGTFFLTLGIGFVLAAGVSLYVLSKSFGLLDRPTVGH